MKGTLQTPLSPPRHLGTRTFVLLTLGFVFITVYGSLVPLHYRPLSWDETFARWDEVRAIPLGINSRSDFVTNVLLFIPLGFLLTGTFAVDRDRLVTVLAPFAVIPLCTALSTAIEFTQLWFPPRVSSMNDVLAETIGAVIGAAIWVMAGQRITDHARSLWVAMGPENVAVKLLPFYLSFLVIIHVMPLDLTIGPGELYHKWKEGRVILIPFTTDYGSVARGVMKNGWNIAYFLPLGLLLSLWPGPTFRSGLRVLAVGLLIAAGITFLKLFVLSRYCDTTDILTGGVAVWLGWMILEACKQSSLTGRRDVGMATRQPPFWKVLIRPSLFLIWFLAMVVFNWCPVDMITQEEAVQPPRSPTEAAERESKWVLSTDGSRILSPEPRRQFDVWTLGPFVVFTDFDVVLQRWKRTSLVPMADLQSGSDYHAFDEVLRKILLFLPLGALLVPQSAAKGRRDLWRALLAGLLLSGLFEAGQLFIPDRTCSTSDVLVETIGAILGFVLFRHLLGLLEGRPAIEQSSLTQSGERARIPVGLGVFITEEETKG